MSDDKKPVGASRKSKATSWLWERLASKEVSSEWPTIENYRKLLVAAVATNANRNPEFRALGPENL